MAENDKCPACGSKSVGLYIARECEGSLDFYMCMDCDAYFNMEVMAELTELRAVVDRMEPLLQAYEVTLAQLGGDRVGVKFQRGMIADARAAAAAQKKGR